MCHVLQGDMSTPLLLAAAGGHVEAVSLLVRSGGRVSDRDVMHRSPLIVAAMSGGAATLKVRTDC